MNNIDFTKNGGLPVTQYTFGFLQSAMANALAAMAMMIGDKAILYGVDVTGGTCTNGWVSVNGELLEFVGGTMLANVAIIETVTPRTYNDNVSKPVYAVRKVQFVGSGGFPFADLKRVGSLKEYIMPVGGIIMWSGSAAAIPAGYLLCDGTMGTPDLSGRFVVGFKNGDIDYGVVGNTGGQNAVALTQPQLPSFNISVPTREANTGGVKIAIGNGGNSGSATLAFPGGDQPHENRPPFYVVCFIIKK